MSRENKVLHENMSSRDISLSTSPINSPSTNKKESSLPPKYNSMKITWNKKTKATTTQSHKNTPPPQYSSVSTSKTTPNSFKTSKVKSKTILKIAKLLSPQWFLPKRNSPSKQLKLKFLTLDPKFNSTKMSLVTSSLLMTSNNKLKKWNSPYLKYHLKISSDAFLTWTRFPLHTALFNLNKH